MGEYQRKYIESEMDRFEQEISSLAPTMTRSFIPAQVRRPNMGQGHGHQNPNPSSGGGGPPQGSANATRPTPIIISGAPQVYNAGAKDAPKFNAIPPQSSTSAVAAATGAGIIAKPPTMLGIAGTSSSTGTIVKPLETPKSVLGAEAKKKKKKKKKKDEKEKKPKRPLRSAGGQVWEDLTLQDWDPNDFRLFCGDLGNDVTDEVLTRVFGRYPSFQKAKVVRDKRTNKTKGFGFVSFKEPQDFSRAVKELDGRYVGSRPIKLRKSNWRGRNIEEARKKEKERQQILNTLIKK